VDECAPVEILPERVDAEVTKRNSIWVHDWYELEHEKPPQRYRARVFCTKQEEQHAVHQVTSWGFAGMHTS
jgi:hypothetical protein